ncbi:MAG: laccase domain-containing protein, partial [Deltaproteobacteria bacterium]|nr:laccase domain-containing protein [Deltaproteobacteria bacterium]
QKRIVEKYIKNILFKERISPDRISVVAGPHIRKCCYSVGRELTVQFSTAGYDNNCIFESRENQIYLSLESVLNEQLKACDISKDNIVYVRLCTSCMNSLFYSHRKGDKGRNINLIIRN